MRKEYNIDDKLKMKPFTEFELGENKYYAFKIDKRDFASFQEKG